jgi:hypothetical protein
MNQPIRPDELIEPVLPPAVDGSYLDGSDRSIETRRLKIEENDIGLDVTRRHSSFSAEGSEIYFKWKFYKLSLYLLQVKTATELRITELFQFAPYNFKSFCPKLG